MSGHTNGQSTYHVGIAVDRRHDHVTAFANLRWRGSGLQGRGEAEIDRDEAHPKRMAEEQAVCRALAHLTEQLYRGVATDVESVTGERVSVR